MPLPLFSSLAGKVGGERRAAGEGQNRGAPSLRSLTATDRAPPPNPKSRVESHGAGDQGGVRHSKPAFSGAYSQGTDEGRRREGRGIRTRARTRPQRQGMRRGGWGGPIR